jgi:hypothetical protein
MWSGRVSPFTLFPPGFHGLPLRALALKPTVPCLGLEFYFPVAKALPRDDRVSRLLPVWDPLGQISTWQSHSEGWFSSVFLRYSRVVLPPFHLIMLWESAQVYY